MGRKDHAIFLQCGTMEYRYVPFDIAGYRIVIANTNVRRSLAESKYNERRAECEEGLAILRKALPGKNSLGEVSLAEWNEHGGSIRNEAIRRRVRHVVTEDARVLASLEALAGGRIDLFGRYMQESHRSLRLDYEVTGEELDVLAEEAMRVDGVLGARMTGAGFGGCTVNIVPDRIIGEFMERVGKKYYERIGSNADFHVSDIGDGAGEIKEG
jgi:galactokinase